MRWPPVPVPSYSLPLAGSDVILKRSGSLSVSVPVRVTVLVVSWLSVTDCAVATGSWFTWVTVIDTVAAAVESAVPSFALNWNEEEPK